MCHTNKYISMLLCLCFFMFLYLCDTEKKLRYPLDPKMKYLGAKLFYIYNFTKFSKLLNVSFYNSHVCVIWWLKYCIHLFQFDVLQQISFSITNNRTIFRASWIWPTKLCYEYIFIFQHIVKLTSVTSVTNLKLITSSSFQIWPKFKSAAISWIFWLIH